MAGNFRGQGRSAGPKDDQDDQHEECTGSGNVHGDLQGMISHAMTLALVLPVSTRKVARS
jgi:hypothetical protein